MAKRLEYLFFSVIISSATFAQEPTSEPLDDKIALGREKLIEIAARRILEDGRFQGFDIENFDRIGVWTDDEYLWVGFTLSVKFVPRNTSAIYGLTIFLHSHEGYSYKVTRNPEELRTEGWVYTGIGEHQDQAREILTRIGYEDGIPDWIAVTITEHATHYEIEEMSDDSGSVYKLRKLTWEIYDSIHEDLAVDEEDATREIP